MTNRTNELKVLTDKLSYDAPKLSAHGTVDQLTQGGGTALGDTLVGGSFIDIG